MSYTGQVSIETLAEALKKVEDIRSAAERADGDSAARLKRQARLVKSEFRYGKMLERRVKRYKDFAQWLSKEERRILKETKDGTLKRKVNKIVMQRGSGRLRGASEGDYLDIGGNQDRSVVRHILDGKPSAPDTSRFEAER